MCYSAGSRGVDENNEDYPSKEVKSNNNVLNFALTRKRVPKVTLRRSASFSVCSFGLLYSHLLLINHDCHIFRFFSLLFVFRKRRSQTVQTPFTKEGGSSIWRRFVSIYFASAQLIILQVFLCSKFCLSLFRPLTWPVMAPQFETGRIQRKIKCALWLRSCWPSLKINRTTPSAKHRQKLYTNMSRNGMQILFYFLSTKYCMHYIYLNNSPEMVKSPQNFSFYFMDHKYDLNFPSYELDSQWLVVLI